MNAHLGLWESGAVSMITKPSASAVVHMAC